MTYCIKSAYQFNENIIKRLDISQFKHFDCEIVDQYKSKDEFMKFYEGPVGSLIILKDILLNR